MIHVIDNETSRTGQVIKVNNDTVLVQWLGKSLSREELPKIHFYGDIQLGFFTRLFGGKNRYEAIAFGNAYV